MSGAGLEISSTALAIGGYLTLNAALALLFWQLRLPEFALTALFLGAFVLQARFMLHAWQSAKRIKGNLGDSPVPPRTKDNVVELDRSVGS